MRRTARAVVAYVAILFGVACLVLAVRIFARAGMPAGMKAVAYLWILPLVIALPVSFGVNLMRRAVSWRRFAAWWLLGWGSLYLAGLLWVLPDYRFEPLAFLAVASPGLASLLGGSILFWRGRRADPGG